MEEVSKEEIELYYVVKGAGGSFNTKLFELICDADKTNQALLMRAFPDFVRAVVRYQTEKGYWEHLQKKIKG